MWALPVSDCAQGRGDTVRRGLGQANWAVREGRLGAGPASVLGLRLARRREKEGSWAGENEKRGGRREDGPREKRQASWARREGRSWIEKKEKLGLGPDREKREFSIFQIFSTLFPNSNQNANQIKFE